MRILIAALLAAGAAPALAATLPAAVATAAAAPSRSADQVEDARRHGPEIAAFAGVKPGQTVVDLIPGGGYWTRLFTGVVGPAGKVYDVWPAALVAPGSKGEARMNALVGVAANAQTLPLDFTALTLPQPADVVFTSQNLHDLPNKMFNSLDITAFSKQVYTVLKPGGRFVVIDHAGAAGTGISQTETLHRIEPAAARKAIEAAGFRFVRESRLLANAADDHSLNVFDPKLRGHTDQFVYLFEKPRR